MPIKRLGPETPELKLENPELERPLNLADLNWIVDNLPASGTSARLKNSGLVIIGPNVLQSTTPTSWDVKGARTPQHVSEPALDYDKIISIISSAGRDMEKRAKTFANMQEDQLRDQLLVALNSHRMGATGETFNCKGKTDILVQRECENVFIGECKIWRGETEFREAIDQLFGYTTRSDNKTALIIVNHNSNTSKVQVKIKEVVEGHQKCKHADEKPISEPLLRYTFQHPKDRDLELTLTVLVFDLPIDV